MEGGDSVLEKISCALCLSNSSLLRQVFPCGRFADDEPSIDESHVDTPPESPARVRAARRPSESERAAAKAARSELYQKTLKEMRASVYRHGKGKPQAEKAEPLGPGKEVAAREIGTRAKAAAARFTAEGTRSPNDVTFGAWREDAYSKRAKPKSPWDPKLQPASPDSISPPQTPASSTPTPDTFDLTSLDLNGEQRCRKEEPTRLPDPELLEKGSSDTVMAAKGSSKMLTRSNIAPPSITEVTDKTLGSPKISGFAEPEEATSPEFLWTRKGRAMRRRASMGDYELPRRTSQGRPTSSWMGAGGNGRLVEERNSFDRLQDSLYSKIKEQNTRSTSTKPRPPDSLRMSLTLKRDGSSHVEEGPNGATGSARAYPLRVESAPPEDVDLIKNKLLMQIEAEASRS